MLQNFYEGLKHSSFEPRKEMRKLGTLDIDMVETTPIVFNGKLYRYEWVRENYWGNEHDKQPYYRFVDVASGEKTPAFSFGHAFGSAYTENGTMYVSGPLGCPGQKMTVFWSDDLQIWQSREIFDFGSEWTVFNNSICKGKDGYIMAIEIGSPKELVGVPFTIVFAKSQNLLDWELLPTDEHIYTQDRYSACPCIRFVDGFYYMIYLEGLPCHRWLPYIVRSKDLRDFELGIKNPIMCFDNQDKIVQHPERFSQEQLDYINRSVDVNNSDIDLCEFEGKTVIYYSWGNQLGKEFLAEAVYDGSMEEFLKSHF